MGVFNFMTDLKNNMIEQYFSTIGMHEAKNFGEFFDNIQQKYGMSVADDIDMAMSLRNDSNNAKIYSIKNSNLELSLDFASYSFDLYKQFFGWIVQHEDLNNKKVLDFACDNGIVTCFLGLVYPDAKVMGIDKGNKGIKCAKELAKKLNLKNVQFEVVDAKKIDKFFKKEKFDTIISVRSILEMVNLPETRRLWTLEERMNSLMVTNSIVKFMKNIRKIMSNDAKLITFERLPELEKTFHFIKCMTESELYVDTNNMYNIQFHELGDYQQMPVIVFDKKKKDEIELNEFIKLYNEIPFMNKHIDFKEDFKKEIEFNDIKDKQLIFGVQIDYSDNSGIKREEVWKTNDKIICYEYSNTGYRELITENLDDEVIDKIKKNASFVQRMGNKVIEYTSIEERDLIK